jgi:hypothetical protein
MLDKTLLPALGPNATDNTHERVMSETSFHQMDCRQLGGMVRIGMQFADFRQRAAQGKLSLGRSHVL